MKITKKEAAKVTHDINNVWHRHFRGKRKCTIITYSNRRNSPAYEYEFINYGFDNYVFIGKELHEDRR